MFITLRGRGRNSDAELGSLGGLEVVIMIGWATAIGSVLSFALYFKMAWEDPYGETWVGKVGPCLLQLSVLLAACAGLLAIARVAMWIAWRA